ncbi:MAG: TonB-dependent receptor [Kordia sp.]|nr:MAG: TonB-dependent receptor [Kordia sp.]
MTKKTLYILVLIISVQFSFSQEEEGNIGTEVINVVKPYAPTVSDAFKVKEVPVIIDDTDLKKKVLLYTIFSIPVASTFTPSKGKAAVVEKQAPKKLYKNYASLAIGNYLNVLAEFYAALPINNTDNFTIGLSHHSAQGEIKEVQLDDKFYDTDLSLTYSKRDKGLSYQIEGVFKHQQYNWYGTSYELTDLQRANINASHTYFTGGLNGSLQVDDSFFKGGDIKYSRFWDSYEAIENSIVIAPEFEFEILDYNINLNATLDYVGGAFKAITPELKYSYLKTGVHPSYQYTQDNLVVNLGTELVFGLDSENSDSDFYVYPKINASYNLVDDVIIAFGGVDGGLQQNSYERFVQQNKYLAPVLGITPTHNQFDAFLGFKGKLSNKVSYELKGSYLNEQNKALYMMNPINDVDLETENYKKANTFGVLYDDVNTLKVHGKLTTQVSKNYSVGLSGEYSSFSTDKALEAWNLPQLKASIFGDFKFSEKWTGGMNLFYVGERMDKLDSSTTLVTPSIITLEGYFDANAHVGYNITNRFTAFLKANNIASQGYEKWQTYPVQQVQILGGLTYKFDF